MGCEAIEASDVMKIVSRDSPPDWLSFRGSCLFLTADPVSRPDAGAERVPLALRQLSQFGELVAPAFAAGEGSKRQSGLARTCDLIGRKRQGSHINPPVLRKAYTLLTFSSKHRIISYRFELLIYCIHA
jgi:hypothetical protein